jgi:hypothetical protein
MINTHDEILVIAEDFNIYTSEIALNIDKRVIDGYVLLAQRTDLSDLIGQKMYADIIVNKALPAYQTLINGGVIVDGNPYYGIKPYLCYSAYVKMIFEHSAKMTASGLVKKSLDFSENIKSGEMKTQIDLNSQKAQKYGQGILYYLNENKSTFTAWECFSSEKMPKTQITKVARGRDKYL